MTDISATSGEPRPWPFAAWWRWVAADLGSFPHQPGACHGCEHGSTTDWRACLSLGELAERFGLNARTLSRWLHIGLTDKQADHLAVLAGTHPGCIWTDWTKET